MERELGRSGLLMGGGGNKQINKQKQTNIKNIIALKESIKVYCKQ
jgi:hypothetical protein